MTGVSATGVTAGSAHAVMRDEFFAEEAKTDQLYDQHLKVMKTFETMTKAELKSSPDPWNAMMHLKLSDHEREVLAEVAKLNGWSRQGTEGFYKLYVADVKSDVNSIGDFLKVLTNSPPGYFGDDGGFTLGLLESDRRRLMGLPPVDETLDTAEVAEQEAVEEPAKNTSGDDQAQWVAASQSRKLTVEEKLAMAQAAKLNGWDEQSATAAFKMYIAKNSEGSAQSFLQLLQQLEPDAYDKDGSLDSARSGNNDDHVLNIEI